jgi:hypothetical protein
MQLYGSVSKRYRTIRICNRADNQQRQSGVRIRIHINTGIHLTSGSGSVFLFRIRIL